MCYGSVFLLFWKDTMGKHLTVYKTAVLAAALTVLFSGCAGAKTDEFFAMDTVMTVTAYGAGAEKGIAAAEEEIYRLDRLLSTGLESSEVSQLNAASGGAVSADTAEILRAAMDLHSRTDGALDITVYPLVELWGFYSRDYSVPDEETLREALALVDGDKLAFDGEHLTMAPGMAIDLGCIAKGYAAAAAATRLRDAGVDSAVLSLGGNVHVLGKRPDGALWKVAIQDPRQAGEYVGTVKVQDAAVVTSGGYQRYFEENGVVYHHILDPRTGYPADSGLLSVTIVSEDDMLADGLSTALFVMGEDEARAFWQENADAFDMVLVTQAGEIRITSGLEGRFSSDFAFEVIYS